MNLRNTLITGLAAVAMTTAGTYGQEILAKTGGTSATSGFNAPSPAYADGDLVLAFFSSADNSQLSGANSNGDVLFDLGSSSSFTGLAAGTYSVDGFNGSATSGQPTAGFGSSEINANLTVPASSTYWSVMGSLTNSSKELWLTGTGTQAQQSSSTQSTVANDIKAIGNAGIGGVNADGSAYDYSQTAGLYMIPSGEKFQNFSTGATSVSATSDTLNLYSLLATDGGNSATKLGFFTLTDSSGVFSLTFTAIPEPSTYAAILGAVTVGFVLVRRRFGASRLNALA